MSFPNGSLPGDCALRHVQPYTILLSFRLGLDSLIIEMQFPDAYQDGFSSEFLGDENTFDHRQPQDLDDETQLDMLSEGTPDPFDSDDELSSHNHLQPDNTGLLPLLTLDDWREGRAYNESPPTCVHYSFEWKVMVNGRCRTKDMEQDVVLAPSAIWDRNLRSELQRIVETELSTNKRYKFVETSITVHVSDRAERDITKRFGGLNIDWAVPEDQLVAWSRLFRAGKKLRLSIEFKCIEDGEVSTRDQRRRRTNKNSTTEQMLSERALEIDATVESVSKIGEWSRVYNLMRCPDASCQSAADSNGYCWCDTDQVHYSLQQHHMRDLVKYAQNGGKLETHGDVPQFVQDQLRAARQNMSNRKRKREDSSPVRTLPPININVSSTPHVADAGATSGPESSAPKGVERLDIPGLREDVLENYTQWHHSKVGTAILRNEFTKSKDFTLESGFSLDQVHRDQNAEFYIEQGIKPGIARSWVEDILSWVEKGMPILEES